MEFVSCEDAEIGIPTLYVNKQMEFIETAPWTYKGMSSGDHWQ